MILKRGLNLQLIVKKKASCLPHEQAKFRYKDFKPNIKYLITSENFLFPIFECFLFSVCFAATFVYAIHAP